jgi:hypothetical protein
MTRTLARLVGLILLIACMPLLLILGLVVLVLQAAGPVPPDAVGQRRPSFQNGQIPFDAGFA